MKKENYSAEELDSWGFLAQARKERKRSKAIEKEKTDEENKEKIIKKFLEHGGSSQERNGWKMLKRETIE